LSWVPAGLTTATGYYKAYFFYYLASTIIMGIAFTILSKFLEKREMKKNDIKKMEHEK
jgi:hypothetical protein